MIDAILADHHRTAFGSQHGTKKDAAVRADPNVAGDDGIRRDICGAVNVGAFAAMLDQQGHWDRVTQETSPSFRN
jgi:hypothetical protein